MAAGAGLTAAADATLANTIVGKGGGYSSPTTNNWVGCFSTQFTASTKAGATEWTTGSDTAYARVPMGAAGAGWTIGAYVSASGVTFTNTNTLTGPTVAGANQTLFSIGVLDTVGPTGGNVDFFADLSTSLSVNIGATVILPATSPGPPGLLFTLF